MRCHCFVAVSSMLSCGDFDGNSENFANDGALDAAQLSTGRKKYKNLFAKTEQVRNLCRFDQKLLAHQLEPDAGDFSRRAHRLIWL